jgi:hypothetical protein
MAKATRTTKTKQNKAAPKKGGVKVTKQAAAKINKKTSSPKTTKATKATKATKSVTKAPKGKSKNNMTNLQKAQAAKRSRGKYEAPNNNTERIGCFLNVNIAKKYLRDLISNTLNKDLGTINAQYPYAALTELLFLQLVRSTVEFNKKNQSKADLYEVTYLNCRSAVLTNNSFSSEVRELARDYDPTRAMGYVNTIYDHNRLRDFITHKAFTNKANYSVEEPALNFLCYLVSTIMTNVIRFACNLASYGNQKNVNIRAFVAATELYFCGTLGALVEQRMAEVQGEFSSKNEDEEVEEEVEEEVDEDEEGDEYEEEDEYEDEEDEDEEEEDEEEEDDEEEDEDEEEYE